MYLEGNSNATETDQKIKMIIGAENALIFYISHAHLIKKRMQVCYDHNMPMRLIKTAPIWSTNLELDKKGIKVRFLTDIRNENLEYCKKILQEIKHVEMRHMGGIRGNFTVHDDKEMFLPFFVDKPGELLNEMLYSSQKQMVDVYVFMFDNLWNQATPAHIRIRELETGIQPEVLHTIKDPHEIIEIGNKLVESAKKEILIIFHTSNAMLRQTKFGVIDLIIENAIKYKTKVKILVPIEDKIKDILHRLEQISGVQIRNIEQSMQTRVTILVVDRTSSLVIELKDDTKQSSNNAIGLAAYSNSKSTVLSYVSIFESFWSYSEVVEKLKRSEELQKQFISIASHELRNPIQPIIGLTEILRNKATNKEQQELMEIVINNAKKLKQITEDVLDVTRIESQSLLLHKEYFNLNEMVQSIISEFIIHSKERKQQQQQFKDSLNVESVSKEDIFISADKSRINQVISNLLNNAIKFTNEEDEEKNRGNRITISIEKEDNLVVVSIKDNGKGIDHEIFPRLFEKFVTKSKIGGTGLGLFISKSIVEAHGGRIWAENNYDGKGATFGFSLPLEM
jgi:two-component system, OmpR family, sensor histidine kinase VicK